MSNDKRVLEPIIEPSVKLTIRVSLATAVALREWAEYRQESVASRARCILVNATHGRNRIGN